VQLLNGVNVTSEDESLLKHHETKLDTAIRRAQTVVRDAIESGVVEARKKGGITDFHLEFHRSEGHHALNDGLGASNAFAQILQQLKSLKHVMPLATKTLTFARTEISKLAKNLDSIFETFADNGPPIFDQVASLWSMVFTLYFCVMLPFPLIMLYYAFWAGGWFGGPGTRAKAEGEDTEPKEDLTAFQKMKLCCSTCYDSCCWCWVNYHDLTLCFWSCCIFLQVVCLLLFLVSLLFCILAAVQIFLSSGIASIYILGDASVCGNTLLNLRAFLATFLPGVHDDHMADQCHDKSLLLGELIGSKMQSAGMYTVMGSMVAAGATFQMVIESSMLHSRAVVRRQIANELGPVLADEEKVSK
jgi:hypothetical protein